MKPSALVILIAAFALCSPVRAASDMAHRCSERPEWKNAITCFVDVAGTEYAYCQMTTKMEMEIARRVADLKREGEIPPPLPAPMDCIGDALAGSRALYRKALASGRESQRALIKDYYAAWRAAMTGIRPEFGEIVINYSRRQAETAAALKQKEERVKLG